MMTRYVFRGRREDGVGLFGFGLVASLWPVVVLGLLNTSAPAASPRAKTQARATSLLRQVLLADPAIADKDRSKSADSGHLLRVRSVRYHSPCGLPCRFLGQAERKTLGEGLIDDTALDPQPRVDEPPGHSRLGC